MRRLIGPVAAVAMLLALTLPAAANDEKVTLCHATNSATNPFVQIEISVDGLNGHMDGDSLHVNSKTGFQDFLLGDLAACDAVVDDLEVTPLAPTVSDATCEAAGTLTLTEVEGVIYTIDPAYTDGASGDFTVTAAAEEGFVLAEGAETEFEVTVPAALDCPANVAALAPAVSAPSCTAPGSLTLNPVTGVTYTVTPAYSAGASGSFVVTAAAAEGFALTGQTSFTVNVAAKTVCNDGTQGGNPPAAPVRGGTLAGSPNTAMEAPMTEQLPVTLLALLTVASLGYIGRRNLLAVKSRR